MRVLTIKQNGNETEVREDSWVYYHQKNFEPGGFKFAAPFRILCDIEEAKAREKGEDVNTIYSSKSKYNPPA